jgi:hypothetical protein
MKFSQILSTVERAHGLVVIIQHLVYILISPDFFLQQHFEFSTLAASSKGSLFGVKAKKKACFYRLPY